MSPHQSPSNNLPTSDPSEILRPAGTMRYRVIFFIFTTVHNLDERPIVRAYNCYIIAHSNCFSNIFIYSPPVGTVSINNCIVFVMHV